MSKITEALTKYRYAFAIWTDRADFITDKEAGIAEDGLLEIRCFDGSGEFYARRDVSDGVFAVREITADPDCCGENIFPEDGYADGSFDEAQYLDIDSAATAGAKDGRTYATGGGSYRLPADAKDCRLIVVRYYYRFDEEGVARKFDWRLTGFTNEENKREE